VADRLVWKLIKADASSFADFSDPRTAADYALCLYAGSAGALIMEMGVPAGGNWKMIGASKGYSYTDKPAIEDGAQKITLKASATNKAKIVLRGRGVNLADPLMSFALPLPVRAQFTNFQTGICWESTYSAASKN